jgi:DNA-damage-inducible protein D
MNRYASSKKAEEACKNRGQAVSDHFAHVSEMVSIGSGAKRKVSDVHLSRYACYLLIQNSDPEKPIVAAQTDAKLRREHIQGKEAANRTHYEVGQKVRQTIQELGGTMPEDLPTPEKSIQQVQRDEQKRLEQRRQPSLFESPEDVD